MARRRTGRGKFTERITDTVIPAPIPDRDVMFRCMIYNFDFDWHEVKPEHRDFLSRRVIPHLHSRSVGAWAVGMASRVGRPDYNRGLAFMRARETIRFLEFRSTRPPEQQSGFTATTAGEDHSIGRREDSEFDRAVQIVVYRRRRPVPPPSPRPEEPPPQPGLSTSWKIRLIALADATAGVFATFEIYNQLNPRDWAIYRHLGVQGGLSTPGYTGSGPDNPFHTKKFVGIRDFEGNASIFSFSYVRTTLRLFPDSEPGWDSDGSILLDPFETGTSYGLGGGVSFGTFRLWH